MTTTNCSRLCRSASSRAGTHWLSLVKVVETSLQTFHVCHADFFLLPRKADTVLHHVNACKNGSLLAFSGRIVFTSSCTGINRKFPPWPNAIHIFSRPGSFKDFMTDMAIPTTSVSFALIIKAFLPFIAACHACTKIRGSASWCIHGAKSSNAITRLQQTYSKHGMSASDNRSARKWKSSVLLLSLKKLFQFWGVWLV